MSNYTFSQTVAKTTQRQHSESSIWNNSHSYWAGRKEVFIELVIFLLITRIHTRQHTTYTSIALSEGSHRNMSINIQCSAVIHRHSTHKEWQMYAQ